MIFCLHWPRGSMRIGCGAALGTPVPKEFGLGILGVWLAAMAVMFPFCAWFAEKKRQSGSKLLSYL